MVSTCLQTCSCSVAIGGPCSSSILELLRERVLVIFCGMSGVRVVSQPPCLLEMLLLLGQRQDSLVHLECTLSKCKVALPDQLLAPFVVAVDVQVLLCNDMDHVLQSIFVNTDWSRVKTVDLQHLTLPILELQDIHGVMLSIQACIGGLKRHQLIQQRRLLRRGKRFAHAEVSHGLKMVMIVMLIGSI
jgi:hypothetical protein